MTNARALAERLIPGEGLLWEVARLLAANALLALCAQIVFPLSWSPVPFTGQTFGVLLIAVLLGARRAALVCSLYLLEGAMGLPVFQPLGLPGAARLVGPTAGYLWSYPVAAFIVGWLAERVNWAGRSWRSSVQLAGAVLFGHALILACGGAWLAAMPHLRPDGSIGVLGWEQGFVLGIAPFLLDAVLKTFMTVAASQGLNRITGDSAE